MKKNMYLFCITAAVLFFVGIMVLHPAEIMEAARNGMRLWIYNVFPSLFPFLIGSEILIGVGCVHFAGVILEPLMRPLFNVPGIGSYPFIMGMTSGYPVGAKIIRDLRLQNEISQTEAQRLLSFCNNSGPLFMLGAVSAGMFKNPEMGYMLLLTHYAAAIATGFLFRFYKKETTKKTPVNGKIFKKAYNGLKYAQQKDGRTFGRLLGDAVENSLKTLLKVGGFIILFSVIVEALKISTLLHWISVYPARIFRMEPSLMEGVLAGIMEITNGVNMISQTAGKESLRWALASGLTAFGGLSIHAQTISILSDAGVHMFLYLWAKIIQGMLAFFFSLALFPVFYTIKNSMSITTIQAPQTLFENAVHAFNGTMYNRLMYSFIIFSASAFFIFAVCLLFFMLRNVSKK